MPPTRFDRIAAEYEPSHVAKRCGKKTLWDEIYLVPLGDLDFVRVRQSCLDIGSHYVGCLSFHVAKDGLSGQVPRLLPLGDLEYVSFPLSPTMM